ncbi:MAG: phenylpropionate dioxygenase-like ring-hydroxylating dioxygenase large terminal subunit, partial [Myxococcota bacterium]
MLPNAYRYPFSPFPDGWFAVGWSQELKAGQVLPLFYMGRELVLYRTESGQAVLADAFCPHLGAHLGHTGSVEGEELRCAFHGFCFDKKGQCSSTSYGSKAPPSAKMKQYPTHEFSGMILGWFHHADAAPDWTVPEVSQEGWSTLSTNTTELRTHPQETTENSVDMGHLVHVHLYRDVRI